MSAYELRISDCSSDVCSSYLLLVHRLAFGPILSILDHGLAANRNFRAYPKIPVHRNSCTAVFTAIDIYRVSDVIRDCICLFDGRRPKAAVAPKCLIFHRSEEHTSELQSLMRTSYAVFCLKNKNNTTKSSEHQVHYH